MDVMATLRAFLARVNVAPMARPREIDVDRWPDTPLDLAFLKELHRAVVGNQESVRRTLVDGSSILADAQPGHVRTKPQAFRVGDHIERAWEQGELKSGLTVLFRDVAPLLASEPVRAAAHLLWSLSRAQPFTGLNERTSLVLASWVLRRAGLPTLHVESIERDPDFGAALAAATANDRSALERYLEDKVWDEALVLVEAVVPVPPQDATRWTLADEHAASAVARARATKLSSEELAAFVADLSTLIEQAPLPVRLAGAVRESVDTHAARLSGAWASAVRGRRLCPHEPMTITRWSIESALGLGLTLVVGAAGRGMTGASSAHLALEIADHPTPGPSLALLLIPDESREARNARTAAWLPRALRRAVELSPLRLS